MPIDNKVDIDTSGPEMDVDIPEENNSAEIEQPEVKEEPTVRPVVEEKEAEDCLLYTSPSPRDRTRSRMPSSA